MKEIYLNLAKYNLWANRRLATLFADLTEEQAEQYIESSFPSMKRTILHIWDAEVIWLKRLRDESIDDFPSKSFQGNFKDLLKGWTANSAVFLAQVNGSSEEELSAVKSFQTITSGGFSHRAFEMVHHCMNHSTYHRGQLITFARQLGMKDLPSTDMMGYFREIDA